MDTNRTFEIFWARLTHMPFGEMTKWGAGKNNHGFTPLECIEHLPGQAGKDFDTEMGLNYFCQRYYDPQIGRFMEVDPRDSPWYSRYAYCANNPLTALDPTGERMDYMNSLMAGALEAYAGKQAAQAASALSPYTGATPGFGSWAGSYESYLNAYPEIAEHVSHNSLYQVSSYFTALALEMIQAKKPKPQITSDEWDDYSAGIEVTEEMCVAEAAVLKAEYGFLASIDLLVEYLFIINATLENPALSQPTHYYLKKWDINIREKQSSLGFLGMTIAHEFAEILWLRINKWTQPQVHPKNPGHYWANEWIRTRNRKWY